MGADYTSKNPIDFDWYKRHQNQHTTGFILKKWTHPFFLHHIKTLLEVSMDA